MKSLIYFLSAAFLVLFLFSSCSRDELDDFNTVQDSTLRTSAPMNNPDPSSRDNQEHESEGITITNSGIDPDKDEDDDDDDEYRSLDQQTTFTRKESKPRKF